MVPSDSFKKARDITNLLDLMAKRKERYSMQQYNVVEKHKKVENYYLAQIERAKEKLERDMLIMTRRHETILQCDQRLLEMYRNMD